MFVVCSAVFFLVVVKLSIDVFLGLDPQMVVVTNGAQASGTAASGEAASDAADDSGDGPIPASVSSVHCPVQAKADAKWFALPADYEKLIRTLTDKPGVASCERRGGALIYHLDMTAVTSVGGKAYELTLPEYIVADEMGGGWREQRSTLQLFAFQSGRIGRSFGPAHAPHAVIAEKGDGAYSHWREAVTDGPLGKSRLRFSLPKNIGLQSFIREVGALVAVVHPMAPPMGWIEYTGGQRKQHQELFRELYFRTFPTLGFEPHVIVRPEEVSPGTYYLWRVGGNHEFEAPLKEGELYELRLPYQIAEYFGRFEQTGGILFPPPATYVYYQNKVALAKMFKDTGVKTPATWVFKNANEALSALDDIKFPVVVKDPYGFSSNGIQQAANREEFAGVIAKFFEGLQPGIEAIVQAKIIALREARVTYIDGRPFHGYWRVRKSLASASAASNMGGFQDFNFPLKEVAANVERFAKMTNVPVGGVDYIWQEANPDASQEGFSLEVSPTSDLNPASPPGWGKTYAEFKYRVELYMPAYVEVRRAWTDLMALAVIDRYRQSRKHLFVDIDNVIALSAARVRRVQGEAAYSAVEVMRDGVVPDASSILKKLRSQCFVRFLTARGSYADAFNVTQTWLHLHGFEYDELIVVNDAEDKVAQLRRDSLLVDDFTVNHHLATPTENTKFMDTLRGLGLPFLKFPFGGLWEDVLPEVRSWIAS